MVKTAVLRIFAYSSLLKLDRLIYKHSKFRPVLQNEREQSELQPWSLVSELMVSR